MVKMDTLRQRYDAEDSTNCNNNLTSVTSLGEDQVYLQNYISDNTTSQVPDPFQCTLQIRARKGEANFLKNLYTPLLEGIDPTFQFICVQESEDVESSLVVWEEKLEKIVHENFECSALSVILFLRETFGRLSALSMQKNLKSQPWKFHHRIELPLDVRPRISARQDFYQAFRELPLWAVCQVHYGNEHLRFHLVVKNFSRMRTFYELITGKKAQDGSPGFCYIPIYTQKGLDIQISLKFLPQVSPKPSRVSRLRFKVKDIGDLTPYLVEPPLPYEKGFWLTRDPDGNCIVLEETGPKSYRKNQMLFSSAKESQDTSDYETASTADTESVTSSKESPNSTLQFQESVQCIKADLV